MVSWFEAMRSAPQAIAAVAVVAGQPGRQDPVAALSGALLELPALVLRPEARPLLSPR